jgi:penicillin-binding protein 1A
VEDGGQSTAEASAAPKSALRIPWGTALRVVASALLVLILIRATILLSITITAHSESWDLPSGPVLEQVLSSCQFQHTRRGDVDVEQMICPTRLPDRAFPQILRDAIIASEDARFFNHAAIDIRSTLRAAWHSMSGYRQGGSTITQQLARTLLLKKDDSLKRKTLEAAAAIRIFSMLRPEEILTRYMNVVPHARSMSGFDDPARHYFGVGVEDLNLAEAALLVGMLPEPNNRDPVADPGPAFSSAVAVLQRMAKHGKITAEDATEAEAELKRRIFHGKLRRGKARYARIEYRPYRDLAIREARANGIALRHNYRLVLFIDPEFQRALITQLCGIDGPHNAAGFFMQPSGEVLAVAGSCTYKGEWNRATDIKRSIGSTGKLFPLIGVHEAGVGLDRRASTRALRRSGWPGEPNSRCLKWRRVSLRYALDHSCNRPWAGTAERLGPRVNKIVRRFGLKDPKIPALVPLGGIYTSPMKLTQAYASLPNHGTLPQVRFLAAAIGPQGEVLGVPATKAEPRVMSPATATAVLRDLRGPVKRGTARKANSVHALVYGKTGTSSRNVDAVFVGLTRDFVGSIWLGHDRPARMPGVHGGGRPAKAFSNLTAFHYVKLAQARFAAKKADEEDLAFEKLKDLVPREQAVRQLAMLGSMLAACFLLGALFAARRPRPRRPTANNFHPPALKSMHPPARLPEDADN